jgi:hypothetical protein
MLDSSEIQNLRVQIAVVSPHCGTPAGNVTASERGRRLRLPGLRLPSYAEAGSFGTLDIVRDG